MRPALLLIAALGALAAPQIGEARVASPALSAAQEEAFASRLQAALEARLAMIPGADAALAELAGRCIPAPTGVEPRLFREPQPRLIGLPGGRVLVSTGLFVLAESDAELASALAHEAGHVTAGDLRDRLGKAYGTDILARIAGGSEAGALAAMAANIASGGVMARHGALAEEHAEDAARAASCEGGLARILSRAQGGRRARRFALLAHPVPAATAASFPGEADAATGALEQIRRAAGGLE